MKALILSVAILAPGAFAQTSCQTVGAMTFCTDGRSYQHIGNQTFGSDGSSALRSGNQTFITPPSQPYYSPQVQVPQVQMPQVQMPQVQPWGNQLQNCGYNAYGQYACR